jgi:hypothetical protein
MIWSYKQVILYFGLINRHLWVILQITRKELLLMLRTVLNKII